MTEYRIDDLLANSVQPFEDLDARALEEFGASFANDLASSPIVVANTRPPVLIEGNQRVRLMQSRGRKVLNDYEVVVADGATTKELAWEEAITRNLNRRQYTPAEKGRIVRAMQAERNYSQSTLAAKVGVSQKTISKWLAAAGGSSVGYTLGADGKFYPSSVPKQQPGRPAVSDGPVVKGRTLADGVGELVDQWLPMTLAAKVVIGDAIDPNSWHVKMPDGMWNDLLVDALENLSGDFKSAARMIRQARKPTGGA